MQFITSYLSSITMHQSECFFLFKIIRPGNENMHPNTSACWIDYILHQHLGACPICSHISINAQSAFHRLKPLLHIHLGHSALWFCTCCSSSHPIRLQTWALIHYQKNKSLKKPQINLNFWKEVKGNKNRTKQHVSNTEELKLKTWFELWMNKTE